MLLRSLDEILADASSSVSYSVLSVITDTMMQGVIAVPARSKFMRDSIDDVMKVRFYEATAQQNNLKAILSHYACDAGHKR